MEENKIIKKEIDLTNLPKWTDTENKGKINWEDSIGYKVKGIYKNINFEVTIINYISKEQMLTIRYNSKDFNIATGNFQYCKLGNLLGIKTNDFKIEIGTIFKDEKRDITIIDRKRERDEKGRWHKYYKYVCNICKFNCGEHWNIKYKTYKNEYWIDESSLLRDNKTGCACCCVTPKVIVKGINDIETIHPHLIKYFVNIEDVYTHTYSSNIPVLMKCPDCGFEKEIKINNLYNRGFSCPKCGDKTPYPEKIVFSVFNQLKINFQTQLSKSNLKWCKNYKYDFYFKFDKPCPHTRDFSHELGHA